MTKIYVCDKCGKEFPQALDEEKYKDIHGDWHVFDLCAPCRSEFDTKVKKPKKDYFDAILEKRKKK